MADVKVLFDVAYNRVLECFKLKTLLKVVLSSQPCSSNSNQTLCLCLHVHVDGIKHFTEI